MNFEGRRGAARTCVGAVVLFFTRVAFGYFTAVAPWPSLVPRGPSPKSPIAQIERRAPRFFSPRERRSDPPRRGSTCLDARRAGRPGLASARRGRRRSPRVRERGAGCVLPRRARPNSGRPSEVGRRLECSSGRADQIQFPSGLAGSLKSINPPADIQGRPAVIARRRRGSPVACLPRNRASRVAGSPHPPRARATASARPRSRTRCVVLGRALARARARIRARRPRRSPGDRSRAARCNTPSARALRSRRSAAHPCARPLDCMHDLT